jgi:hypothetical protein
MTSVLDAEEVYEDYPDADDNQQSSEDKRPDFYELFDAPDWSSWLKVEETAVSKEYRKKANSFLKMLMTGCLNTGNFPDAAAIIDRGPAFARAVGQLSASNETVRKGIDLVMLPDSPVAQFIATGLPLLSQLYRNHEETLSTIPGKMRMTRAERKVAREAGKDQPKPEPKFTIRVGKRIKIPVRINMKMRWQFLLGGMRAQTVNPNMLTYKVFGDQKVVDRLTQMGVTIRRPDDDG